MSMQEMSEEELLQLLSLGNESATGTQEFERQRKLAELMRTEAPQMRGNSRVQRAPHFLELAGGLARQTAAQTMENKAGAAQEQARAAQTEQNKLIAKELLRQKLLQQQAYPNAPQMGQGLRIPQGAQSPGLTPNLPSANPYGLY